MAACKAHEGQVSDADEEFTQEGFSIAVLATIQKDFKTAMSRVQATHTEAIDIVFSQRSFLPVTGLRKLLWKCS